MRFGFGEPPSSEDVELVLNAQADFLNAQNDLLAVWGEARNRCGGVDYSTLAPALWDRSNKQLDRNDPNSEAMILNNWISDFQQYGSPSASQIVSRIDGAIQAMNEVHSQVVSLVCPASVDTGTTGTTGATGTTGTTGGRQTGTGGSRVTPGPSPLPIPPTPVKAGLGGFGLLGILALAGYLLYQKYGKKMAPPKRAAKRKVKSRYSVRPSRIRRRRRR